MKLWRAKSSYGVKSDEVSSEERVVNSEMVKCIRTIIVTK